MPLVDHRIIEFAWSLRLDYKLRDGVSKLAAVPTSLPAFTVARVPIDSWLRGPLREWAEDLLAEDRLRREAFFDPAPIRQRWTEHRMARGTGSICWGMC